jgi:carboxypeptidase D
VDTLGVSTAGTVGTWGRERGLTFYEVNLAGHELPRYGIIGSIAIRKRLNDGTHADRLLSRYAPGPSYRATELLLGRISSLSDMGGFTTQQGSGDVDKESATE